jgi:outer membrane receptor for ferrienterochelin and colicin
MKKTLLIVVALLFAMTLIAQTNKGVVYGSLKGKMNKENMEYASVALYDLYNNVVAGTMTDSLGNFRIENIKYGTYHLICSYVGCKDLKSKSFSINKDNKKVNLGTIFIDNSNEVLQQVEVTGKKTTYTQTIDKKVFDVGSDLMSSSSSVSDLMQNIPSVQVDVDGNISLRGNENVLVLIDGKPSIMTKGSNRATILQQIPASEIERVEVITNPSAEFKPDGTSGIINIIRKKDHKRQGLNGTLTANVGNQGRWNSGLNLFYSNDKINVKASYNHRYDRKDRLRTDNRQAIFGNDTITTNQERKSKLPITSNIVSLGFGWNITKKDYLEASGSYNKLSFPRVEDNHLIENTNNMLSKDYLRHRFDNEKQKEGEAAVSYSHTFTKDKVLNFDYTYSLQDEVEDNHYTNTYALPFVDTLLDNTLIKQRNDENLFKLTYNWQINDKSKMVVGYEMELDKSNMRYFVENYENYSWVKDSLKSNDFIFNEKIHSLYATYEREINKFSFLLGVRAEKSFITNKLLTMNMNVKDNYLLCYPTIHTQYDIDKNNTFQMNYSFRVNRPEGEDLNPFPEYQDPYNIFKGNPYLKPEKIHSFEIGWQWKKDATTFILTPYYRYAYNKMTRITTIDSNNVTTTTKENMSSSKYSGVELIFTTTLFSICNLNFNSNFYYNQIDASDIGYSKNKGAFAYELSLNANTNITKSLVFQTNLRYTSSFLTPQGNRQPTFVANIGAKYDIKKYNLSLIATVSDLFDTYKNVTIVDMPYLYEKTSNRRTQRVFYFGVSYNFGTNTQRHAEPKIQYDEQ